MIFYYFYILCEQNAAVFLWEFHPPCTDAVAVSDSWVSFAEIPLWHFAP